MKVLVTGGFGFLGSHLCKRLRGEGHSVYCFDGPGLDVRKEQDLEFIDDLDEIYNLASIPSPHWYKTYPLETIRVNIDGMENVLKLAQKTGAKVLQASTIDAGAYFPSDHSRACYVDSKKVAEDLCMVYYKHGVKVKIARMSNVYGPGMLADDGRVIPTFITRALRGEPLEVWGDGSQQDSFCFVDDMITALVKFMRTGDEVTGPLEFGDKYVTPIKDLAGLVLQISGSLSEIVYLKSINSIPKTRVPNTIMAEVMLGWKTSVSLPEGLGKTVEYFKTLTR